MQARIRTDYSQIKNRVTNKINHIKGRKVIKQELQKTKLEIKWTNLNTGQKWFRKNF